MPERCLRFSLMLLAVLSGGACENSGPSQVAITGRGYPCTGPIQAPKGYVLPVSLEQGGRVVASQEASGPNYAYRFLVKPGRYRLTAPGDIPRPVDAQHRDVANADLNPGCL